MMVTAAPTPHAGSGRSLLLVRHAKAADEPDNGGAAGDHARDLSERGLREAGSLGRTLQRLDLLPDLVLVSSALRTRRTWEAMGEAMREDGAFGTPVPELVITDRLYLATAGELRAVLREVPEPPRSVMLVGHNPGLHELALQLAGAERSAASVELQAGLPTCTAVAVAIEGDWRRLFPLAGIPPRILRP